MVGKEFNVLYSEGNDDLKKQRLVCSICDTIFSRASHLKSHVKMHDDMRFKCDRCSEIFFTPNQLATHLVEIHKLERCQGMDCAGEHGHHELIDEEELAGERTTMVVDLSASSTTTMMTNNMEENYCFGCDKQFETLGLKRQHDEIEHAQHASSTMYKCLFEGCSKVYENATKLNRHSKTHLKVKKFKCHWETCNAEFTQYDDLTAHLNLHDYKKPITSSIKRSKSNSCSVSQSSSSQRKLSLKKDNELNEKIRSLLFGANQTKIVGSNVPFVFESPPSSAMAMCMEDDEKLNNRISNTDLATFVNHDLIEFSNVRELNVEYSNNNHNGLPVTSTIADQPTFHSPQPLTCNYCNEFTFSDDVTFQLHLKTHFDIDKTNEKLNSYLKAISNEKSNLTTPTKCYDNAESFSPSSLSLSISSSSSSSSASSYESPYAINNQSNTYVNNYDGENLLYFCPIISETNNVTECCGQDPVELNTSSNTFDQAFSSTSSCSSDNNNIQAGEQQMHQFLNEITDYLNENPVDNSQAQNTHDANNPPDELKSIHFNHSDFFSYPNEPNDYVMRMAASSDNHQPESLNTNEFITLLNESGIQQCEQTKSAFKQEHVITMNSDDEEYTSSSVILENLSGSARTDYKSNHTLRERKNSKNKLKKGLSPFSKKLKVMENENEFNERDYKLTSPMSSISSTTSPMSVLSTTSCSSSSSSLPFSLSPVSSSTSASNSIRSNSKRSSANSTNKKKRKSASSFNSSLGLSSTNVCLALSNTAVSTGSSLAVYPVENYTFNCDLPFNEFLLN